MTYPSDHQRDSLRGSRIEQDQHIVNGSILALTAFAIVVCGIAWYAVTGHRNGASLNTPALERPDMTTGYGAQPRIRMPDRAPTPPQK